jgi:predicted anti-sigma-YlaC factor YlaD
MAQATGNFPRYGRDYPGVLCEDVRVALSARLDGEPPEARPGKAEVDRHLAGCPDCVAWLAEAQRLAEAAPGLVPDPPDLTGRIMAAVGADPLINGDALRRRAEQEVDARRRLLRIAVGVAAVAQLALAVPTLVSTFLNTELGSHTGREMACFDIALAIGFLYAAYRPGRARAFVPVALVLAMLLAVTSGVDVVRGAATFAHEVGHLVAVVQAGLLWALSRLESGRTGRVARPRVAGTPR